MVMDTQTTTAKPENSTAASPLAGALNAAQPREQSWGEKYAGRMYAIVRNVILNYLINFSLSAALTYAFDTSKYGILLADKIESRAKIWSNPARAFRIPQGPSKWTMSFLTKSQVLLCGGHFLQPLVKWMSDHRNRLEFRFGHALDLAQECFGQGTQVTKRNIEDYHRVSSLISIGDHNRKQRDAAAPSRALSDEDKQLLAKHHIGEDLQFVEHRRSWGQVLKARLMSIFASAAVSIVMGLLSAQPIRALNFRLGEKWIGEKLGANVVSRLPIIRSLFSKRPALIGEYFIDDAILTAAATGAYVMTEKRQGRKEAVTTEGEKSSAAADTILNAPRPSSHTERFWQNAQTQPLMAVA